LDGSEKTEASQWQLEHGTANGQIIGCICCHQKRKRKKDEGVNFIKT
jgi:hypothetical protein